MTPPSHRSGVLLVEDDDRLAKLTSRYLEGAGLIVSWVTSGLRVLEDATAHGYDVILLDLMLPGRDGIDVCRELRTRLDVPIIMLTARREEVDVCSASTPAPTTT